MMVKSKYKKILLALVVLFLTISSIALVNAQTPVDVTEPKDEGVGYTFQVGIPGVVGTDSPTPVKGLGDLVNKVVTLAYRISMLFVLFKIVSIGFKYMTSRGNADIVASVSKGMKNVLIGILILFGSYLILKTINPDLTKIPNNINCPPGAVECDGATGSKFTETVITCPVGKLDERTAEDLDNGIGIGSDKSTSDVNITSEEIEDFISSNFGSFRQSGDWTSAKKDLLTGKVSANIWSVIKKMIEQKDRWLPVGCHDKIEFGPIFTNHLKAGDYTSCHDSYDAVDLVVRDASGNDESTTAKGLCMDAALVYIRAYIPEVTACDERECPPPHIHIQDVNCKVGCRTCP